MAVLGKRKAVAEPTISEEDAAAIFRRHFEAQFAPLPDTEESNSNSKKAKQQGVAGDDESDDSDGSNNVDEEEEDDEEWGGLSGDDSSEEEDVEVTVVEVVDHSSKQPSNIATMSKRELKAFMVRITNHLATQMNQLTLSCQVITPPGPNGAQIRTGVISSSILL
jgi:uncharacterized protein with von Willebrand factor type A (vWA) domain